MKRAFTLVELLTVIAIIALLAGIFVPVSRQVIAKAKASQCLSNLRQIGEATHLYLNDHRERLPAVSHLRDANGNSLSWTQTLAAYLGPDFIGRCPSVPDHPAKVTYGWNDLLVDEEGQGVWLNQCHDPSLTMAVAEISLQQSSEHLHFRGAARGRVTAAMFKSFINVDCHSAGANYLFVDGHVRTLDWADIQQRLKITNTPFLNP